MAFEALNHSHFSSASMMNDHTSIGISDDKSFLGREKFFNNVQVIEDLKASLFYLLNPPGSKKETRPAFSASARGVQGFIGDASSFFRGLLGDYSPFANSPALRAMGITTGFSGFWGTVSTINSIKKLRRAIRLNDPKEILVSSLELTKSIFQTWGGISGTIVRGLKLSILIEKCQGAVDTVRALTDAVGGIETSMSSSFGFLSGVMGVMQAIKLYDQSIFISKLNEGRDPKKISNPEIAFDQLCKELQKYITFLEDQLKVLPCKSSLDGSDINEIDQKMEECFAKSCKALPNRERIEKVRGMIQAEYVKEAMNEGYKGLKKVLRLLGIPIVSSVKAERVLKKLFSEQELVKKGKELKARKLEIKKEGKLAKLTGEDCVKMIKNAAASSNAALSLSTKLGDRDITVRTKAVEEARPLLQKVQKKNKENLIVGSVLVACFVISFVLAFFVPPVGIIALITTGLSILVNATFLVLDIRSLRESIAKDELGKYDTKVLTASTVICIAAIVMAVALTLIFGFGLLSLSLLIIGVLWLGINSYTLYSLKKHTLQKLENNPTLEIFEKAVKAKKPDEKRVKRLFVHLKEEDQNGIKHKLWKMHAKAHGGKLVSEKDLMLDKNHDFGGELFALDPFSDEIKLAIDKQRRKNSKIMEKMQAEQLIVQNKLKESLTTILASA